MKWILTLDGETIAQWVIPGSWEPNYGSVLAVRHEGRLKNFRVVGAYGNAILLQIA